MHNSTCQTSNIGDQICAPALASAMSAVERTSQFCPQRPRIAGILALHQSGSTLRIAAIVAVAWTCTLKADCFENPVLSMLTRWLQTRSQQEMIKLHSKWLLQVTHVLQRQTVVLIHREHVVAPYKHQQRVSMPTWLCDSAEALPQPKGHARASTCSKVTQRKTASHQTWRDLIKM